MELVSKQVEADIAERLGKSQHVCLIIDGWSERSTHYLGVFAAIPKDEPILLAFAPYDNEEELTADEHIRFLNYVLDLYKVNATKIRCIIADNTVTNKACAIKMGPPFIGCASLGWH